MSSIVVFKLGGSLLTLGDLPERLAAVLELRKDCRRVVVVGGGPVADFVREMFRLHRFGEEAGHWLAVRGLSVTSHLAATVLPGCRVADSRKDCESAWDAGTIPLLDSLPFLSELEARDGFQIPHQWEFTSDSIAALAAREFGAAELVLLKSVSLLPETSLTRAAEKGWVDRYLPEVCKGVPKVTWVNLRERLPNPTPVKREP